jgi:hypothetical protein
MATRTAAITGTTIIAARTIRRIATGAIADRRAGLTGV